MGWGVWIGHSGPIKRATIMMMGATNIGRIYYPVCLVCQGRVHFLESALTLLHTPSQSSMLFITNCLGCIITHWAKAFRDSLSCVLWLLKLQFTWKNACKKNFQQPGRVIGRHYCICIKGTPTVRYGRKRNLPGVCTGWAAVIEMN